MKYKKLIELLIQGRERRLIPRVQEKDLLNLVALILRLVSLLARLRRPETDRHDEAFKGAVIQCLQVFRLDDDEGDDDDDKRSPRSTSG